jgi:hypothetical protein
MRQVHNPFLTLIKQVIPDHGRIELTYSKRDGNFYFRTREGKLGCIRDGKLFILNLNSFRTIFTGLDERLYVLSPNLPILQYLSEEPVKYWKPWSLF